MRTPPHNPVDPAHAPRPVKTLRIDGLDVSELEHQTVLEVALENGIRIPALCHMQGLSPVGACPPAHVVSVAGANFEPGEQLSPAVSAAMPALLARVRALIGR